LLINWLSDETSRSEILDLLKKKTSGLATLSGLLQSESVATYLSMIPGTEDFDLDLSPFRRRDRNLMDA
jgi:hypothetical protein